MKLLDKIFRNTHADAEEAIKMSRLVKAEEDLRDLQRRGDAAVQFLTARAGRNHWREAVEQMIQGVS